MTAPTRRVPALRTFHAPADPGLPPLLIFPHAGAGASSYRDLSARLAGHYRVAVMQYPGRQDRGRQTPATSLTDLAQEAFDEFGDAAPVTLFGHSMGSIVGFEFARLADAAGVSVQRLVVSAAAAPSAVADLPRHPTDDDSLLAHLNALQGTGGAVMGNEALIAMALPVLRADYQAFDAYRCEPGVRVQAPIDVLGGADDPVIAPYLLQGWTQHADDVSVTLADGGHFYLNDDPAPVVSVLTRAGARR